MRIVIDLQGAQSASRFRGIGRYSQALAQAMVRNRGSHEIIIALNGLFPETIEPIRAAFDGLLPQENIRVWQAAGPVHAFDPANNWRRYAAEMAREAFLQNLQPDVVHITSLVEGFDDNAVHSIGRLCSDLPCAVTFYDVIPLIQSDVYLKANPVFEKLYTEKLNYLKRADLFLAISESSRREAIDYLGANPDHAINIAAATEPHFKPLSISKDDEAVIRRRFGLDRPFVMYSGATDERKNHLRLIKAFAMLPSAVRKGHQLAIVGGMPGHHQKKFEEYIKFCGLTAEEVVITGRVSDEEMVKLYNLCKLFVFPSWHEGFGLPALEAMSCGAPVIGSDTTSIPEVIGRKDALFSPFDTKAMSRKIARVLGDKKMLADLAKHGLVQATKFSWDESARRAIAAFERMHEQNRKRVGRGTGGARSASLSSLLDGILTLEEDGANDNDFVTTARALAQNYAIPSERQLLVDISELVQRDVRTGVQRVVRSVLVELLKNPPAGFKVEPIYATTLEPGYRYARKFVRQLQLGTTVGARDEPIDIGHNDVFIGLDLSFIILHQEGFYEHLRKIGVPVYFCVYDLLPNLLPELFPSHIPPIFDRWLAEISKADGVFCISRAVADEMAEWVSLFGPKRMRPFNIGWFHLGADLAQSIPTTGMPADADEILVKLAARPSFLMVGTIEPRKNQMQALAAFESLWDQGVDVNLVLVGKHGWNVDLLVEMLRIHPELNHRLFWLQGVSDEYLEEIYASSSCLILAASGEGFGLPLIEAAQHNLPVIARDLLVFREIAGDHAHYFSGFEPEALAAAVGKWLSLNSKGQAPDSSTMPWLTWKKSVANLVNCTLGKQWYKQIISDDVLRFVGSDSRFSTQIGVRKGRDIQTSGKEGYLIYGPYCKLEVGEYRVVIRGQSGVSGTSGVHVDIVTNRGGQVLAKTVLGESVRSTILASLQFSVKEPCVDLEIRVMVPASAEIAISMLEIQPIR
ncbi:glycosyltransferase family 4 protein [Burkholderia cenocepacia]|nr:glycosyltransferase family 4 protein [Burkholderia cenocepacia]